MSLAVSEMSTMLAMLSTFDVLNGTRDGIPVQVTLPRQGDTLALLLVDVPPQNYPVNARGLVQV